MIKPELGFRFSVKVNGHLSLNGVDYADEQEFLKYASPLIEKWTVESIKWWRAQPKIKEIDINFHNPVYNPD